MAVKHITDLDENVTAADTDLILTDKANGTTLKTKLVTLLKRVFRFEDVYDDYQVNINAIGAGSGNSAPTLELFRDSLYMYEFPVGAQITEGFFMIHLMHDMKPDTDMTFHLHWTHNNAAPTGNIKWNIDYSYARGYGQDTFPATIPLSTVQAVPAQYTHQITNDDDMVISSTTNVLEPDGVITGRIWRDSTDVLDTTNANAFLLQVDVHYVKSRTGTTERNPPFTSGGF